MNLKSLHSPAFAILALTSLATVAWAVNGNPAPTGSMGKEVTVTRISPHTSLSEFEQDVPLEQLADDTGSIISNGPDGMDEVQLADELTALGWSVVDVFRDDNTYTYVIDVDGYVHQICVGRGRVIVDTDDSSPSVVILEWTQGI